MKSIKSIIFIALSIFVVGTVISQTSESKHLKKSDHEKKTPEERAQHRTDRMTKKLDLSESQIAEMNKIQRDIIAQEDIEREARKARKEKQQAQIRSILTSEQAKKFDESLAKRKEKRKGKRGKKRQKRKEMKMQDTSNKLEEK